MTSPSHPLSIGGKLCAEPNGGQAQWEGRTVSYGEGVLGKRGCISPSTFGVLGQEWRERKERMRGWEGDEEESRELL